MGSEIPKGEFFDLIYSRLNEQDCLPKRKKNDFVQKCLDLFVIIATSLDIFYLTEAHIRKFIRAYSSLLRWERSGIPGEKIIYTSYYQKESEKYNSAMCIAIYYALGRLKLVQRIGDMEPRLIDVDSEDLLRKWIILRELKVNAILLGQDDPLIPQISQIQRNYSLDDES